MKYTFGQTLSKNYMESMQTNPLRWEILYKEGNHFIPQTGNFRCKDYFNDIVAKYHDVYFTIYGFDNSTVASNPEGVWVRLHNLFDYGRFAANIERTINSALPDADKLVLGDLGDEMALVFLPVRLFSHTYTISLVTWFIRICNNEVDLKDMQDAYTKANSLCDFPLEDIGAALANKWGVFVPDDYKDQWWYCGVDYNALNDNHTNTFIHNNGVRNWANYA